MNELALFAGAGGGILGTHLLGWRPVAAVEIEAYRREILLRRQRDGLLPLFPVWDDAQTFDGKLLRGHVDVITAGFPCQPFSLAGKRLAEDDPRNGWPHTIRIIREVGPVYALLENVPGLLAHPYFGTVLGELAESGFDAVWDCFPASAVGAPHRRDRLFILAYANKRCGPSSPLVAGGGGTIPQEGAERKLCGGHGGDDVPNTPPGGRSELWGASGSPGHADGLHQNVADTKGVGVGAGLRPHESGGEWRGRFGDGGGQDEISDTIQVGQPDRIPGQRGWAGEGEGEGQHPSAAGSSRSWWAVEPDLGRVAHGVAHRVDRLESLGDGQVPGVVVRAWQTLSALI